MTPKQLAIASHRVLKMLRKRPLPYKCTQLQTDTSYSVQERRNILAWLRHNDYIKDVSFVDIIVTEKGKQTRGYYATRFDTWYNALPGPARYLLSPATATLVMGFFLFSYIASERNKIPGGRHWHPSGYYYYKVFDAAELATAKN
jgi:hypothetical protein